MTRLSPVFLATAFALAFATPAFPESASPELQVKSAPLQKAETGQPEEVPETPPTVREGTMTLERMGKIVRRLDANAERKRNGWRFTIEEVPVVIVTDPKHDRMRILVGIRQATELKPEELLRLMQANFDSALDARYAVANGVLWSAFVHPLQELHDRQFISAIGQTVNLALTYGSSYTSGALVFGGGDSNTIRRRELIDRLLKQGQPI